MAAAMQPKSKRTATAPEHKAEQVHSSSTAFDRAMMRMREAQEELMAVLGVPSWQRALAAFVTGIGAAIGIGWLAGLVVNSVTLSVLAFTGSGFIATIVWLLGFVASCYYGGKAAAAASMSVYTGVAQQRITESYYQARGFVTSLFGRGAEA